MRRQKRNSANITEMLAAIGSGAAFTFGIESMSKRVDFISNNYMVVKSLSAGFLGSSLAYFGTGETAKASGYGLLGIAGGSAASKLATVIATSSEPVNGARRKQLMNGLESMLCNRRNGNTAALPGGRDSLPAPAANVYSNLAFSDPIYL